MIGADACPSARTRRQAAAEAPGGRQAAGIRRLTRCRGGNFARAFACLCSRALAHVCAGVSGRTVWGRSESGQVQLGQVGSGRRGRSGSGRVGSDREGSRRVGRQVGGVGSDRVRSGRNGSGRVGSGRIGLAERLGSNRVGSRRGRSGQVVLGWGGRLGRRVGSARLGSALVGSGDVGSGHLGRRVASGREAPGGGAQTGGAGERARAGEAGGACSQDCMMERAANRRVEETAPNSLTRCHEGLSLNRFDKG